MLILSLVKSETWCDQGGVEGDRVSNVRNHSRPGWKGFRVEEVRYPTQASG